MCIHFSMASAEGFALALCALLSVHVALASVDGKEPYLDFTCVASQALVPTVPSSINISITAYSPLSNASHILDGEARSSFHPDRVGDFRCLLETEDYQAETTVIVSTEDASLYPPRLTVTYDPLAEEEDITLQMIVRDDCQGQTIYRWREAGNTRKYSNSQNLVLHSADTNRSSIVFRAFFSACKFQKAYVQVLVRECPSGKWGPDEDDCQLDCSICLNGGMCHPQRGQCICPPGFSGSECQTIHGRNVFGQLGQYNCSLSPDPHDHACQGKLFCLPEPFGCTCAAGYKGISCSEGNVCSEECEDGMYGANCEQRCHCQDNSICLTDTGECIGSSCLEGWSGPNCQDANLLVSLTFVEVNINQMTNITCTVRNRRAFNESAFVLVRPDGTVVGVDYFIYEAPVVMEYLFYVKADSAMAMYTCTDVAMTTNATVTVTAHEPPQLSRPPTVLNSTSSTVTLTWEAWGTHLGDRGEGPLVKYVITYRELAAVNATVRAITAGETPGNTTLFVVRGLTEAAGYEFQVAAARPGMGGVGAPSPPTAGNTTCAVPGLPTDLTVKPLNATFLYLTWSAPTNALCPVITYHVTYWIKRQGQCTVQKRDDLDTITTRGRSIEIGELLPDTLYKAQVTAETDAGIAEKGETGRNVTDESVPEPPILLSNETTSTTLQVVWSAPDCHDRNGIILGYQYQLFDTDMNTLDEGTTSSEGEGIKFDNLLPCTEYLFRVRAWTSAGNGSFSDLQTATTKHGVPDDITNLQISAVNSSQVRLHWFPPVSVPCPIIDYTISYTLVQQGQCDQPEVADNQTISTTDTKVDLTELLPYAEYEVVIGARTAAGEGVMSNGSIRTLEGVAGPPVLLSNETTSTTLQFMWSAPDCQDRNGIILGYQYQLFDTDMNTLDEGTTSSEEEGLKFDNLLPCTEYLFQVRAWTSAGNGSFSDLQTATTKHSVPDEITNLQISAVNSSQVQVHWFPPVSVPCPIIDYTISYTLVQQGQCEQPEVADNQTISTTDTKVDLTELLPYTEYEVVIGARTAAGEGVMSNGSIRTLEGVPGPPVLLSNETTNTTLQFMWSAPDCQDRNGIILGYQYQLFDTDMNTLDEGTSSEEEGIKFDNLLPCTEHLFQVRAWTSAGNGSFSDLQSATTKHGAPGAVGSLRISPTARTLEVTWQPPSNLSCDIAGYNLTYVLTEHLACQEKQEEAVVEAAVITTDANHTIGGLSPYAEYRVSVAALTSVMAGESVSEYTVTLPDVPSPPISVHNTLATSSSLGFAWQPPACADRNGIVEGFHHQLADTGTGALTNGTSMANDTAATFDDLSPCTEYAFTVRARTSVGYGLPSLTLPTATLGQVPNAVTDFQVHPAAESVRLTWLPPDNITCPITSYSVSHQLIGYLQCPEEVTDSVRFNATRNPLRTEYTISGLKPAAKYAVSVRAETVSGFSEERSAEIETLESIPGMPRSINLFQVTPRFLAFEWEPPACTEQKGTILLYNYRLVDKVSKDVVANRDTGANTTTAEIQHLVPCTRYHFKVRAKTSKGFGNFTEAVYALTNGEVPEAVTSVQMVPGSDSIHVEWDPPANKPCALTGYLITYQLIRQLQCTEAVAESVVFNVTQGRSSREYRIEGLLPASRYSVAVRAINSYGRGVPVARMLTTQESFPGAVTNLTAVAVGRYSANFSWSPPACEDRRGNVTGYRWYSGRPGSAEVQSGITADTSLAISTYKPCSEYTLTVLAETNAGLGQDNQSVSITTLVAVPDKVETPRTREKNATSALVTWPSPVSAANPCPIQHYRVRYYFKKALGCQLSVNESFTLMTKDPSISLVNLRPYSTYKVQVGASTSEGDGEMSEESKIVTDADVPDQVTGVKVTNATMDSLRFAWSELECAARHDRFTTYQYEFISATEEDDDDDDERIVVETTDLFAAREDLDSCTEYAFRVRAVGSEFEGIWSSWVKAITTTALPEKVENLTLQHGANPASQLQVSWQPYSLDKCSVGIFQVAYWGRSLAACSANVSAANWTYDSVDNRSVVLRDLRPYSLYTVTVRGETVAGLGEEASASLQTEEDVPSGPPQNVSTDVITPNSIHFVWLPPACTEQNGLIVGYNYTLLNPTTNETVTRGLATATEVLISGLAPYVDYIFSVQASTMAGPGPLGHLLVKTDEGVPSPPRNTGIVSATSYTLALEWQPPSPPSGIISAYRIKYWPDESEELAATIEEHLSDLTDLNDTVHYVIMELKPHTQYHIEIQGKTGAGYGDWSETITHQTDQAAPEKPANASVLERTDSTITIHWERPPVTNGILTAYKIEFEVIDRPFTASDNDVATSATTRFKNVNSQASSYQLDRLESATGYEVRVAAETVAVGSFFTLRPVYTTIPDISPPTMPGKAELSDDNTVTLRLQPSASPYISAYRVTVATSVAVRKRDTTFQVAKSYKQSPGNYIAAEFNKTSLPPTFQVGDNKTYGRYFNAQLHPGTTYDIQFCGIGETQADIQSSCSEASSITTHDAYSGLGITVLLVCIIVPFLIVITIMFAVIGIHRRKKTYEETVEVVLTDMEKGQSRTNGMQNQAVATEIVESQLRRSGGVKGSSTTPAPRPVEPSSPPKKAWKPHKPVSLQDLPEYVKKKKANGNKAFTRDYASFPDQQMYPCEVAQEDINQKKNRYANIIPYDHSRVILDRLEQDLETDYINASYIDGYKQQNAYIATQGPNKHSTPDFWHMIWQQEVAIIVMLTNLVENAKKKCVRYWPEDQLNYNDIVVKLSTETVEQDFTVRVFVITNINIEEDIPREVKQFHFTSWPDMGLPDSPAPLMSFIHEVKQTEEDDMGPMVVHCSAGVGRTGTFITVDAMLNMVAEERHINVIDFVHKMRKKRPKMVQTQEQYMFIFEVLLETLLCGDTVMGLNLFPAQYAALQDRNPLTGNSYIEEHFRVLDTMSVAPSEENCHGGRNELNLDKNRYHDCIPLDKSRPYLMSPGDEDSTNYINASFIDTYRKKDGFIATQCPLPNTVGDFWRMVYDYNARVIVMLNPIDGTETCASYWLDDPEETALYGIFEVKLRDCKSFNHTVARTFKLNNTNKLSEKPRTIHHFEFQEWDDVEEVPSSAISSFLSFLELVEQGYRQNGGDGRIAVHCLDGVSRCGVFCAVMASLAKLKEEKVVDVFHAVRNLRRNRDIMVETQDQYLFCYDVLKTYLEVNQTYANFR